jgi:2-polyprenyl-3-methyl-5-hydroxy-6-metoxy-1,4-benzoquinol methylase
MPVDYSRQTVDNPNPVARFAHRRRYAASLGLTVNESRFGVVVLDYGCGEGQFLKMLADRRPDLKLLGYDPFSIHGGGAYRKVDSISEVNSSSVGIVTCFETLEHLDEAEMDDFLVEARRLLPRTGKLIVSVPIIGGPTILLKEANRMVLHRKRTDYTIRELLTAAVLGRPAPRPPNVKGSHKGFDYHHVPARVTEAEFRLRQSLLSPFPSMPWWCNSQAFFVFARR